MADRELRGYDPEAPRVSIVVLNFNRPEMTIECLESLWAHTRNVPYEVIVVDNGSTPENQDMLAAYQGPHRLIRLTKNRFFGEGNNIGAELARGEFVLFMNNDVTVTEGWLEPLVGIFDTHPDVGSAGPKFVYPSGELQEAGALIDTDGSVIQIGKFQSPDNPRFNRTRPVDYVSAACVIMRHADFDRVHGFDFRYEPAYYEDCDLCLKIASLGKTTYYVAESAVVHHESVTTSDGSHNLRLDTIVEVNKQKFLQRWHPVLQTGLYDGATWSKPVLPPNAGAGRKTAGFYTPYDIIPGGGERYLFSVMKVIESLGYDLTLILPERYSRLRISEVLDRLDLELPALDIMTLAEAEQGAGFDFYYCLGNEIAPRTPALGQFNVHCCQFPFDEDAERMRRAMPWLADYDVVVCYSEFVEVAIREKLAGTDYADTNVQVVHPPVGLVAGGTEREKSGILGIGRFFAGGHCKRQDMMIEAFRDLVERGVDTELHLVGSLHAGPTHREYLAWCQHRAEGLPVTFHIDAAPDVLADLLDRSLLYWHATGFEVDPRQDPAKCEHFGISVVEAMSAGAIPLVVGHGGPAAIVQDGRSGFHYETQEQLVELSQQAITAGHDGLREMRAAARRRADEFSFDAFRNRWVEVIDTAPTRVAAAMR